MAQVTKGSETLKAIAADRTQVRIAADLSKRLGRSIRQGSVTGWVNGLHTPGGDVIAACQALYGIDAALWFKPARRTRKLTGTDG